MFLETIFCLFCGEGVGGVFDKLETECRLGVDWGVLDVASLFGFIWVRGMDASERVIPAYDAQMGPTPWSSVRVEKSVVISEGRAFGSCSAL